MSADVRGWCTRLDDADDSDFDDNGVDDMARRANFDTMRRGRQAQPGALSVRNRVGNDRGLGLGLGFVREVVVVTDRFSCCWRSRAATVYLHVGAPQHSS